MICRICHSSHAELLPLKCKCLDDDLKYVHMECADKWYKDKVDVVWCGKLTQTDWIIKRYCLCEVCTGLISPVIVDKIFFKYANNVENMKIVDKRPDWVPNDHYPFLRQ